MEHANKRMCDYVPELERKKEAKQREREAREKEARRREKAEEKEKRRKEYNAQMEALAAKEQQKRRSEEKKRRKAQAAGEAQVSIPKPLFCSMMGWKNPDKVAGSYGNSAAFMVGFMGCFENFHVLKSGFPAPQQVEMSSRSRRGNPGAGSLTWSSGSCSCCCWDVPALPPSAT